MDWGKQSAAMIVSPPRTVFGEKNMAEIKKPDLRDRQAPKTTLTNTDENFAGDENRNIEPPSAKMVTPDPSNVPEGQTTKM